MNVEHHSWVGSLHFQDTSSREDSLKGGRTGESSVPHWTPMQREGDEDEGTKRMHGEERKPRSRSAGVRLGMGGCCRLSTLVEWESRRERVQDGGIQRVKRGIHAFPNAQQIQIVAKREIGHLMR